METIITDTRMEELTREVREHNNFARRAPVLEEQIKVINYQIANPKKSLAHKGVKNENP